MTAKQINVIGYHGQTVFHSPAKKVTIQLGDGALLANLTGIPVINDFRTQDILSGGQGAPFAPLYHQALAIRDKHLPLAVVNCGGIANVTIIQGPLAEQTVGFDTGPGNGLIDRMVKSRTQGKECMDENAVYGIKGHVHEDVLQALYARSIILQDQNFFDLPAPKSLDINDLQLIPDLETLSLEDACATLEAFTADTIVRALEHVHAPIPTQWVLTGGGWHNPVIHQQFVTRLTAHFGLQPVCIKLAKDIGWNSAAIEAQLFAYLAIRSLKKMPISYPNITHVPMPLCGGTLHAII
jgi:anhydro-N-acetylmuramic acid kinase